MLGGYKITGCSEYKVAYETSIIQALSLRPLQKCTHKTS